jgi:hypothetical protein
VQQPPIERRTCPLPGTTVLVRAVMDEEADAISRKRLLRLAGAVARKRHAMRPAPRINSRYGCSDSKEAYVHWLC